MSDTSEDQRETDMAAPIMQLSDLLPGDVLLYRPREPDGLQRRVIAATGSPYTHAAIVIDDNKIAEALIPVGVGRIALDQSLEGSLCVAVLRTQLGFGSERQAKLREFVDVVIAQGVPFHRHAANNFGEESRIFFDNQLDHIRDSFGRYSTPEELAAKSFFCSGFVVACYQAVGLIGNSAQVAFPPEFFSPAKLYQEASFGWLLGYIIPQGGFVPPNDPLIEHATLWRDIEEQPWWALAASPAAGHSD
jgi:hypothetical protein